MSSEVLAALKLPKLSGDLLDAYPEVDPGVLPLGSRVLLQIKSVKETTKSGLILANETKSEEQWNTQVARVIANGPIAFCNRSTGQPWPEGVWAKPGQFVRIPRWGGDRWERKMQDGGKALFVLFEDRELIAVVTTDPSEFDTYIL